VRCIFIIAESPFELVAFDPVKVVTLCKFVNSDLPLNDKLQAVDHSV